MAFILNTVISYVKLYFSIMGNQWQHDGISLLTYFDVEIALLNVSSNLLMISVLYFDNGEG